MKRIALSILMLVVTVTIYGQMMDPVHFTSKVQQTGDQEAELVFTATIDKGWHVYSTNLGSDGPVSATLQVNKIDGAKLVGKLQPRGKETRQFDPMFGMELRYFEHQATFVQRLALTRPQYDIDCCLEYGACSNEMCLPPAQVELKAKGKWKEPEKEKMADTVEKQDTAADSVNHGDCAPVIHNGDTLQDFFSNQEPSQHHTLKERTANSQSLTTIFLLGFLGGLLAVLMPCIWPIIPMTVSFFLKRNQSRGKAIREAVTYGISIVVIYLALGLLVTAIFGASTLNALSTNAVVNVGLFLLLVIFALSFFGWFEIRLPASWSSKVDAKADELSQQPTAKCQWLTAYLSIFLMALTLVLVSFSCTAPIIGLLLVETSTSGQWVAPAIGMLGFALALALPFTLFALFPSWLKQAPKSGSWMNIVKVTLAFIELAFALKFLSVADLAYGWHILDREVFLSLWIAIFGLLGAYLCGWLRFPSDGDRKAMPVPCIMGGLVSLAFTIYMIPGLWGAPLKAISAFTPPMYTQDFVLSAGETGGSKKASFVEARFKDYDEGLAAAKAEGKPVMIDFTGFGCVNCRKMEAAVWTDQRVADVLNNDYVLISLYVDDKTALAEPVKVVENGKERLLRTVGDKWSYLQRSKFGANAQPFYILLDHDGNALSDSRGYNEDIEEYLTFLQNGLLSYRARKE